MQHAFSEDAMTIARNILSGRNACGTLRSAVDRGDHAYFAAAAEAVLKVRSDELGYTGEQRDLALKEAEKLRFALELVVQNLIPEPDKPVMTMAVTRAMQTAIESALGRGMPWDAGWRM